MTIFAKSQKFFSLVPFATTVLVHTFIVAKMWIASFASYIKGVFMYKYFLSVKFGLSHFCLDFFWIWLCSRFFLCPKLFLCFVSVKKSTCVFYYIKIWKQLVFQSVKKNTCVSYFIKIWKHRKSLGHRNNLEHSQIQKKSRQKWLSPNFFLSVKFLHGQA